MNVTQPVLHQDPEQKPVIYVDIEGEDGNAYFLVSAAISALWQANKKQEAAIVLMTYSASQSYEHLSAFLGEYITIQQRP
jgi:hypothetical protein